MGGNDSILKRSAAMLLAVVVVGSILASAAGPGANPSGPRAAGAQNATFTETTEFTATTDAFDNRTRDNRTGDRQNRTERVRQQRFALVRFGHMADGAGAVDVFVDGDRVFDDVSYGNVTSYLRVPAGEQDVRVTRAGDRQDVLYDASLQLNRDARYTLAASRNRTDGADGDDDGGIGVDVYRDRLPRPGTGQAAIRVVNLAPDAPAVSLVRNRTRQADGQQNRSGQVVVQRVEFRDASNYTTRQARFYRFNVVPAEDRGEVLAASDVSLERGAVYTMFVAGEGRGNETEGTPLDVFVNVDATRSGLDNDTGGFGTTTADGFFGNDTTTADGFFGNDTTTAGGFFGNDTTTADGFFNDTTEDGFFDDTTTADGAFGNDTTADGFFDDTTENGFNDTTEDGFFGNDTTENGFFTDTTVDGS